MNRPLHCTVWAIIQPWAIIEPWAIMTQPRTFGNIQASSISADNRTLAYTQTTTSMAEPRILAYTHPSGNNNSCVTNNYNSPITSPLQPDLPPSPTTVPVYFTPVHKQGTDYFSAKTLHSLNSFPPATTPPPSYTNNV